MDWVDMGSPSPPTRAWASKQLEAIAARPNPLQSEGLTDSKREAGLIAERAVQSWLRGQQVGFEVGDGIRVDLQIGERTVSVKDRPTGGALRPDYFVAQPTEHMGCDEAVFVAHFRSDDRYVILGGCPMQRLAGAQLVEAGQRHRAFGGGVAGRDNYLLAISELDSPSEWVARMTGRSLTTTCECGRVYIRGREEWTTCLRCSLNDKSPAEARL